MSEDTDPSDDTDFPPEKNRFADEAFVIGEALSRFGETARLKPREILVGPGDDAAVLDAGGAEFVVVSCDSMVEGVHFKKKWMSLRGLGPEAVGDKAVLCAASDVAAMGAVPKTVLVSAGLPAQTSRQTVKAILDGVARACESVGALVVGGNTTSSPALFIDISVMGETVGRKFVRRRGAREGDAVFVTGNLGGAEAGLRLFESLLRDDGDESVGSVLSGPDIPESVEKFHFPRPRISVGLAVCGGSIATAMTDLSDGLVMDLSGITSQSGVGAELFLDKLPVCGDSGLGPRDALTAGGDYELLFTAPPEKAEDIRKISKKTGVKITRIGGITKAGPVRIFGRDGEISAAGLGAGGFMHNRRT